MNHKSCILDMDGVITTNSEELWLDYKTPFFNKLMGKNRYEKMRQEFVGLTNEDIYDTLLEKTIDYPKSEFMKKIVQIEKRVYRDVTIDVYSLHSLAIHLKHKNFQLGIVTSSSQYALDMVLSKLPKKLSSMFSLATAISARSDLKSKPHPDGYIDAMLQLGATPQNTIVVEDSNIGIRAAKAAGVLTIGLRQNLIPGYVQSGSDISVETISDLIRLFDLIE